MIFHTNELFSCRVLKKVKDYTLFPLVWLNEVRNDRRKPSRVVEIRHQSTFFSLLSRHRRPCWMTKQPTCLRKSSCLVSRCWRLHSRHCWAWVSASSSCVSSRTAWWSGKRKATKASSFIDYNHVSVCDALRAQCGEAAKPFDRELALLFFCNFSVIYIVRPPV